MFRRPRCSAQVLEPDNLHIFKQLHRRRCGGGWLEVTPETPVRQIIQHLVPSIPSDSLKIQF